MIDATYVGRQRVDAMGSKPVLYDSAGGQPSQCVWVWCGGKRR